MLTRRPSRERTGAVGTAGKKGESNRADWAWENSHWTKVRTKELRERGMRKEGCGCTGIISPGLEMIHLSLLPSAQRPRRCNDLCLPYAYPFFLPSPLPSLPPAQSQQGQRPGRAQMPLGPRLCPDRPLHVHNRGVLRRNLFLR